MFIKNSIPAILFALAFLAFFWYAPSPAMAQVCSGFASYSYNTFTCGSFGQCIENSTPLSAACQTNTLFGNTCGSNCGACVDPGYECTPQNGSTPCSVRHVPGYGNCDNPATEIFWNGGCSCSGGPGTPTSAPFPTNTPINPPPATNTPPIGATNTPPGPTSCSGFSACNGPSCTFFTGSCGSTTCTSTPNSCITATNTPTPTPQFSVSTPSCLSGGVAAGNYVGISWSNFTVYTIQIAGNNEGGYDGTSGTILGSPQWAPQNFRDNTTNSNYTIVPNQTYTVSISGLGSQSFNIPLCPTNPPTPTPTPTQPVTLTCSSNPDGSIVWAWANVPQADGTGQKKLIVTDAGVNVAGSPVSGIGANGNTTLPTTNSYIGDTITGTIKNGLGTVLATQTCVSGATPTPIPTATPTPIPAGPWYQAKGGDVREDYGITDALPASGALAMLKGVGGTGGIMFSGDGTMSFGSVVTTSNFAQGSSWHLDNNAGTGRKETWAYDSSNRLAVSYDSYDALIKQNNITTNTIDPARAGQVDGLLAPDGTTTHGIFRYSGTLNITQPQTFTSGNYIFLVNDPTGINISAKILVKPGATVMFLTNGNITLASSLGETTYVNPQTGQTSAGGSGVTNVCDTGHTNCDVEGIYVANGSINIQGTNGANCGGFGGSGDPQLNIGGTLIANATGTNVTNMITSNPARNLCTGSSGNGTYPAYTVTERPDFLINLPDFVRTSERTWQEVAP